MASENTIYFYPGQGGHSHDGENSSFIDTTKYSLFDFSWGLLGDPSRIASQTTNYNSFQNFIVETVNNAVLKPAGLILQPGTVNGDSDIISNSISTKLIAADAITANEIAANTITANEIAANTITAGQIAAGAITADELAANIVLVNNVISSSNYSPGVSGWSINSNGAAEFANTSIRGTITANSVTTPGIDIDSSGNLTSNASTFGIYANGAIFTSSNNFRVDASGNLTANNASITGTINATDGYIGDWEIGGEDIISGDGGMMLHSKTGPGDSSFLIAQEVEGTFASIMSDGSITLGNDATGTSMVITAASLVVNDSISRSTTITGGGISGNLGYVAVNGLNSSGDVYVGLSTLSSYSFHSGGTITATTSVGVTSGTNSVIIEAGNIEIKKTGGGTAPIYINRERAGTNKNYCVFALGVAEGGAVIGSIAQSNTTHTQYNTTSDSRLKINVDKPYDALAVTNLLMPRTYKMLLTSEDEKDDEYFGFFAQELYEVYPQAVSPGIDASEQNIDLVKMDPWSIDYSKLTPLLTKAIQELCIKVEVLEQKVVELESN